MKTIKCEYIWVDGVTPTPNIRSKTRVFRISDEDLEKLNEVMSSGKSPHEMIPVWGFDGSSTCQAKGDDSDCALRPVLVTPDPIRPGSLLVLSEVFTTDLEAHNTNTRSTLRKTLSSLNGSLEPRIGFEQEYTLMKMGMNGPEKVPLGWPSEGSPKSQGDYYCGVGSDNVAGREISEAHLEACLDAGLTLTGTNATIVAAPKIILIGFFILFILIYFILLLMLQ